ncbi:MAG TPA: hypothetical protein VMD31_04880 [Opitutaceae bacterium]|nr:hypothetical protein [Opitutaceae bacterium]
MKLLKHPVAALEVLLVTPAVLFMTALFVRDLQPQQFEPARSAQQIVAWYAARPRVGLWGLLIGLPFAVLVTGSVLLLRQWQADAALRQDVRGTLAVLRAHFATLLVAGAMCAAAGILAIVALHVATD